MFVLVLVPLVRDRDEFGPPEARAYGSAPGGKPVVDFSNRVFGPCDVVELCDGLLLEPYAHDAGVGVEARVRHDLGRKVQDIVHFARPGRHSVAGEKEREPAVHRPCAVRLVLVVEREYDQRLQVAGAETLYELRRVDLVLDRLLHAARVFGLVQHFDFLVALRFHRFFESEHRAGHRRPHAAYHRDALRRGHRERKRHVVGVEIVEQRRAPDARKPRLPLLGALHRRAENRAGRIRRGALRLQRAHREGLVGRVVQIEKVVLVFRLRAVAAVLAAGLFRGSRRLREPSVRDERHAVERVENVFAHAPAACYAYAFGAGVGDIVVERAPEPANLRLLPEREVPVRQRYQRILALEVYFERLSVVAAELFHELVPLRRFAAGRPVALVLEEIRERDSPVRRRRAGPVRHEPVDFEIVRNVYRAERVAPRVEAHRTPARRRGLRRIVARLVDERRRYVRERL